jgi:hypothetical protein
MSHREKTLPELEDLEGLVRSLGERIETLMLGMRYRGAEGRETLQVALRRARDYLNLAMTTLEPSTVEHVEEREATWLRERLGHLTSSLARSAFVAPVHPPPPPPRAPDGPGFQGDTGSISMPDLLHMLSMQRQTGTLTISLADEDVCLEFATGELTHAFSRNTPSDQRLGEILVRRGILTTKQLDNALRGASDKKSRIGDALRTLGLVKEADLRAALDEQMQGLFHRIIASPCASYVFREGMESHAPDRARVNLMQLLLESSRKLDERRAPN